MQEKCGRRRIAGLALVCSGLVVGPSLGATDFGPVCRPLNALGNPTLYDVNDKSPAAVEKIGIVEANHFTPQVQALQKGQTSSSLDSDLDFVLRAIPNHYQALSAMGRWQLTNRFKGDPTGRVEMADCYFRRAKEFRPPDPNLSVVYGVYLQKAKRYEEARREYERAESLGGESAELYYNFGLLWFEMGDRAKAQEYAEKAYSMGYPLPGLRNKLRGAAAQ